MNNNLSCADYLSALSEPELRCWIRLNLSKEQITQVWLSINGSSMDKDMQNSHLSHYIIALSNYYNRSVLNHQLAKAAKDNYQILLNTNQINQTILDLISQSKQQQLTTLDLSCLLLTSLPNDLFELTHLENLYLAGNFLTNLPDNIYSLTSLQSLDLLQNNISSISCNISKLANLSYLDLSFNQLSSLPAEIGNLANLSELDLSFNQLNSLPAEIGNLANLSELDLSFNQLNSLPAEIGNLANLSYLNLFNNKLSSLPVEIGNLANLSYLNLFNNKLSSLPVEIGNLANLSELYLSDNQISSLPTEIGNLANLSSLSLRNTKLSSLPAEIFTLANLSELDLSSNQLSSLPAEIGNLANLSYLDLSSNQLSSLLAEIGNLANLSYLDLSDNQLSNLPAEIGNLVNLSSLDLSSNQLSNLPTEISNLANLSKLNLSINHLKILPSKISNLFNLSVFDLSVNQLSNLPAEISNLSNLSVFNVPVNRLNSLPSSIKLLTNLKKLDLQENELLPIPPEILDLKDEPAKILNYYFDLISQKEKQRLNEVKMLVVGEGKVGKTSLVNRLVDNTFNDPEPMTEGVIIKKHWPVKLSDEREIKVNIWDFGGQEIMHSTHQFFLTKRSLYLLVLDSRKDEQPNRLDYWLKTIESFADNAPIIIVCNQTDCRTLELDQKTLKAKYPSIKAFAATSCSSGKGINSLKEIIAEEISKLKHIDDQLLTSWFKVKEQLEELQKTNNDYLEYSKYQDMCKEENINKLGEETLIDFLHDLGTVLCFHKDLRLRDTNILNPAWVTEGVYKILNYQGLGIDKGELKTEYLDQIFNDERYPRNKHNFILEMMVKFELCFDLDHSKDRKLIPDLLPKKSPNLADLENWNNSLRFEYHYDLLPSSVISRFIVRMNAFIYDKTYWRYGVVLISEDKFNKALVKADLDANKIFIFVDGRPDSRKDLLFLIRADLRKIYNTIPKLQFEQKIPLPENPSIALDYQYLIELLDMGEESIIPPGLRKKIAIKPLLEGIERKSTNEVERLYQALLKAYDYSSFKQMLRFKLGKDLDAITTANGFNNVVFDLIIIAERQGWLDSLVHCAKDHNSGNESLNNVANTFFNKY